ncbi:MAG: dipeptidase [Alphaproteobacteria bacterium]
MNAAELHQDAIILDGLVISKWSRPVFEDMRRGGLTAANCTCSVWEGIRGTMDNVAEWKRLFCENADLILQVFDTSDIARAKKESKTGIILGWQNTSGIEDRIEYLQIYKNLGLGIMQLTYNTQNFVGSGCYEGVDSGLSDFGRDVVDEMNRVGILVDLSHVGAKTSDDAIRHSKKPVAYSHCLPSGLKEHQRNKSDEQLKFIAGRGGFIGVTMFPAFLKRGTEATVDDYVEAIEYVMNIAGQECVGFGTDFTQDYGAEFFRWITHDKGNGRKLVEFGEIINPEGMRRLSDYPNLTAAMERAGWPEPRIRKVMGENWVRVLKEVWGA